MTAIVPRYYHKHIIFVAQTDDPHLIVFLHHVPHIKSHTWYAKETKPVPSYMRADVVTAFNELLASRGYQQFKQHHGDPVSLRQRLVLNPTKERDNITP